MGSSFKFDTTRSRSDLMKKIRSSNTIPELSLRKELWKLGYRYRLNLSKLKGKPDIVFNKFKLVVFVDGEFWHGYEWRKKKPKLKANREYWIKKIERNIERDKENNKYLRSMGYVVLRFWEHEIKKDLVKCVNKIVFHIIKNS